jgi:uncharacterized protein (UPF0210 family)
MKIRTITLFLNPSWPFDREVLGIAEPFIAAARTAYEKSGYEVQTTRLASVPFPLLVTSLETTEIVQMAQSLEAVAKLAGFEYVSIGPALPQFPASYAIVPEVLAATDSVFLSGMLTTRDSISLVAVRACAEVIHRAAGLSPDGFANLRFAALANVPPGVPFFPAAYHDDKEPAFALGVESADLAVKAFTRAATLDEARQTLTESIEYHAKVLAGVGRALARRKGVRFGGIDFSLVPFPEEALSIGTAMERLGVPAVGLHGTLAAAALLTDILERARFPHTGFNGLFLPVLEDARLARRAAEGSLTVKDLLLYSAVCGTGLDTLPLPGDTSPEALAATLLDLACLAQRLGKPLTARLMPIPGKTTGDPTDFDFSYFANSRVMSLQAEPLTGALERSERLELHPRGKRP